MLATVSPVMVGAEAASPQPTHPSSDSMRTRTLSARATVSPAIFTGFFIGKLTAIGSIALIFTIVLDRKVSADRRGVIGYAVGWIAAASSIVASEASWRQGAHRPAVNKSASIAGNSEHLVPGSIAALVPPHSIEQRNELCGVVSSGGWDPKGMCHECPGVFYGAETLHFSATDPHLYRIYAVSGPTPTITKSCHLAAQQRMAHHRPMQRNRGRRARVRSAMGTAVEPRNTRG